jgi:large subunit ribosomal protein L4
MATPTFTKAGAKAATAAKLDKTVFDVDINNHELLKLAYTAYLANGRENYAVVKTRGLVRGGGRKPWKQKGTGRARFGSTRNPIWRGGGIVFGPTGEENYRKELPTTARRTAIRQALTMAAREDHIAVIEEITSKGKTSELAKLLKKVGANRRTLIVVENKTDELVRASQNLQKLTVVAAGYLNVYDLLNADRVVIETKALDHINTWLGGKK